jgi:hypothetical protein
MRITEKPNNRAGVYMCARVGAVRLFGYLSYYFFLYISYRRESVCLYPKRDNRKVISSPSLGGGIDGWGAMTLPGSPAPPRSSLNRGTRSPTTTPEMEALRRRVWQQQGVASLAIEDITDPWLRQAVQNEAVRRWGPRQQEKNHGR